eukprot:Gb_39049 [translate_table: standard]
MASNGFAKVLQRNSWRLTTILVYAVLEWILIFLLLISALFQFMITKFASFFGLHPPCLWCSRLDHILESKEPDFYRKLICDRHAREISLLGYCLTHRKLAEVHGMCEECLLSRPTQTGNSAENTEDQSNWITCMSVVANMGLDLAKRGAAKGFLMNGHCHLDDLKTKDVCAEAESKEKISNGWVSNERCSCCNSPMNEKLHSQSFLKAILSYGQQEGIMKSSWNALDYAENGVEVILEKEGGWMKPSECICGGAVMKISEVFLDSPNASDVGSSLAVSDDGEIESREVKLNGTIGFIENVEDIMDIHSEEDTNGAQKLSENLEGVQNAGVRVEVQSDIYVDKRIAYPDIVTEECAIMSDVTVAEITMQDASNDEGLKQLALVEEPPVTTEWNSEAVVADMNDEAVAADTENQNETIAVEEVGCESLQKVEVLEPVEMILKGLVKDLAGSVVCDSEYLSSNVVSLEIMPKSSKIEEGTAERKEIDCMTPEDHMTSSMEKTQEEGIEDGLEHPSDDAGVLPGPLPMDADDQGASLISEGGDEDQNVLKDIEMPQDTLHKEESSDVTICANNEAQILEDSEADGKKILEEDHCSPILSRVVTAASSENACAEVASPDETPKIPEDMNVDFGREGLDVGENQAPEEIQETNNNDNTRSMDARVSDDKEKNDKSVEDAKPISRCFFNQSLNQVEIETDSHVHDGVHNADEDGISEVPSTIEGIHTLHKRMIIERKDSGVESLDGSVVSEIDGEFVVDRLKRTLEAERKALNTLYSELEEERSASAIAANETMAMITRLQEEKAAVQMEALQYQRMMEEQSEYDQEALQLLNEILVKREKEKQELEKEVELYRKRLLQYEAKERRMEKRRKEEEGESRTPAEKRDEIDPHLEGKNNEQDQTPDNHSRRIRTSSTSSLSDDSDEISSDVNDVDDGFDLHQSNQNTPAELTMSAGRGYEDPQQKSSLDESLADFEEERLSILEQLKVLEEKLHTLADDEQIGMAHPEANGVPKDSFESVIREDYPMQDKTQHYDGSLSLHDGYEMPDDLKGTYEDKVSMETMNGNSDHSHGNGSPVATRVAGAKAKRLLPLFDATSVDEDAIHHTEEFSQAVPSDDWRTVSMVARDNNRLAIEEEVYHVYERLQALEADREFLKHSIKSLRKGDEGMKLLQEIAQHLRDLRSVELKARSCNDTLI